MDSPKQTSLESLRATHARELKDVGYRSHVELEGKIGRLTRVYRTLLANKPLHCRLDKEELAEMEALQGNLHKLNLDNKQAKRDIQGYLRVAPHLALFLVDYPPEHPMRTGGEGIDSLVEIDCRVGLGAYRSGVAVIARYREVKALLEKLRDLAEGRPRTDQQSSSRVKGGRILAC